MLVLAACSNSSPVGQICDIMNRMAERIDKMDPQQEIDPQTEMYFKRAGLQLDSIRRANEDYKLTTEDKEALKEAANKMGVAVVKQQAKALGMETDSEEMRTLLLQTEHATNQSIDNMTTLGDGNL